SGYLRCVDPAALDAPLDADAEWTIKDTVTLALLKDALQSGNLCYLPAPGFGTAVHIEPLVAYAVLALCTNDPITHLMEDLGDEGKHLLNYPVDAAWCGRFLTEIKARWAVPFGKATVFC
ncbi:MAG: hypothetical protein MK098_15660, partial [Marinovum sp.]|nr:hypothetical protein [Marinovum sp.]